MQLLCPKSSRSHNNKASGRCSSGALLRQTFHNLMHHMLSPSLKPAACDRQVLICREVGPCTAQPRGKSTSDWMAISSPCVWRNERTWLREIKVSTGRRVGRRWQTEIHGCKRGMTAMVLSSRLQFAENKMSSERPNIALIFLFIQFEESWVCVCVCVDGSHFLLKRTASVPYQSGLLRLFDHSLFKHK